MSASILLDNKISEEKLNLRYSDIDFDKSLKPFSLLNFFQDLASDNAEELGFGYSYIYPKNLIWVLLKYHIEFNKYPVGIHNMTLKTEPRGYNKLFAYRNFELSTDSEIIAKASSMWSLVNVETMKLTNIEDIINNPNFGQFKKADSDLDFAKIPKLTSIDMQKEFEVRYNDIDVNMHANNGNYIIWALEPLNPEFRKNKTLKTVDITFKKEIKYGEKLISRVQIAGDTTTIHELVNLDSGEDLCLLNCEWRKN